MINTNRTNSRTTTRLTPAAREILKEAVLSYRIQILQAAEQIATNYGDELPKEVTSSDILSAIKLIPNSSRRSSSSFKTMVFRYIPIVGILYVVIGLGIFAQDSINFDFSFEQSIGIGVAFVGIFSLIFYYLYGRQQIDDVQVELYQLQKSSPTTKLVTKWHEIELAIRKSASKNLGESFTEKPISILIQELGRLGILSQKEKISLKSLLIMRNSILHKKQRFSSKLAEQALKDAERILGKLY